MNKRPLERILLAAATLVLAGLFVLLFQGLEKDMADVPQRLQEGSIVNLNTDPKGEALARLLAAREARPREPRLSAERPSKGNTIAGVEQEQVDLVRELVEHDVPRLASAVE